MATTQHSHTQAALAQQQPHYLPQSQHQLHHDSSSASIQLPPKVDAYRTVRAAALALSKAGESANQAAFITHSDGHHIFQSSAVPDITLADYAVYIAARCSHGEEAVLIGLVLMARYCRTVKQLPTAYTEHRLLLAAIVVGSKAHYDDFYKNVYMARIGGVTAAELRQLELSLILSLRGSVVVHLRELESIKESLVPLGAAILDAPDAATKARVEAHTSRFAKYHLLDCVAPATEYCQREVPLVTLVRATHLNTLSPDASPGMSFGQRSTSTVVERLRTVVADASMNQSMMHQSASTPHFAVSFAHASTSEQ